MHRNGARTQAKVTTSIAESSICYGRAGTLCRKGLGPILINTVPAASVPTAGLIDTHHPQVSLMRYRSINGRLAEIARAMPRSFLSIPIALSLGFLARAWVDPKLWYYGRLPFSPNATRHLALAFAGAYRALKKGTAKVLALDLDNTLWGGVYGEDGVAKLLCDDEFPGNAFKAFQRECLRLKSQGFLLALLSKNNPDAISVVQYASGHVAEGGRLRRDPHQLGAQARSISAASPRS